MNEARLKTLEEMVDQLNNRTEAQAIAIEKYKTVFDRILDVLESHENRITVLNTVSEVHNIALKALGGKDAVSE